LRKGLWNSVKLFVIPPIRNEIGGVMKKGFFHSQLLLYTLLFLLSGCASFLQLAEEDDPNSYDRGYASECSGAYCDDTVAEGDSGFSTFLGRKIARNDDEKAELNRSRRAIETRDVVLGMTRKEVISSWGEPIQKEVAGRGTTGHERWTFGSRYSLSGSKTVIFEDGKVAGWGK